MARSGPPLDPIGFVAQLVFPDLLVFPLLWEGFWLIVAGICSLLITSFTSRSGTSWTLRPPLFSQGFSIYAFAKHWGPLGALGAPFGPIGFDAQLVFPDLLVFPLLWKVFWLIVAGAGPLLRGAPGQHTRMYCFYKGFEGSGRVLRGASHGLAI